MGDIRVKRMAAKLLTISEVSASPKEGRSKQAYLMEGLSVDGKVTMATLLELRSLVMDAYTLIRHAPELRKNLKDNNNYESYAQALDLANDLLDLTDEAVASIKVNMKEGE